jgi:L-rhamnose isomerase
MENQNSGNEGQKDLRKIIDIPHAIVKDLKKMAVDADATLKAYIQDLLVDQVEKRRNQKNL